VHLLILFFEFNDRAVVTKFKIHVQLNSFHYKCMEKMSLHVHCNTKWKNKF